MVLDGYTVCVCGSQRYNMDYEAKNRMEELMSRRNDKPPGVDRGRWTLQEVGSLLTWLSQEWST